MSEAFDPYRKWLGIPPSQQPPHHYRLLGIELYESDVEVIDTAAGQRMSYLQELAGGQYVKESQKLLNEVSAARRLLLDAKKKAEYDAELKAKLAPAAPPAPPKVLKQSQPLPKAVVAATDEEETVTLNLSEATAQLKKRGVVPAGAKSPTVKKPDGAEKLDSKAAEAPRPIRRKKSSPVPALIVLAVVGAGAVGALVMRDKFAPVAEEEPIHAVTPAANDRPSEDEYADYQYRLQKQELELLKAQQAAQPSASKRTGVKFTTPTNPASTASGTTAAASTPPFDATFFATPATKTPPKATGTGTAPVAAPGAAPTGTAAISAVDAKAAAAARGRVTSVPATDKEVVKDNESLFTPKEGLPKVSKPTATATTTGTVPAASKPTGTAVPAAKPTATPSATATPTAASDAKP